MGSSVRHREIVGIGIGIRDCVFQMSGSGSGSGLEKSKCRDRDRDRDPDFLKGRIGIGILKKVGILTDCSFQWLIHSFN